MAKTKAKPIKKKPKARRPKWAEYVTFSIGIEGKTPMILVKMPREGKWNDVRQAMFNIVYSFGGQRKDLLALDGLCSWPDQFSEDDLFWAGNRYYKDESDKLRPRLEAAFKLEAMAFPAFYLYKWHNGAFVKVRNNLQ